MSIASLLKRLTRALPAVIAAVPAVFEVVKQVGEALRKPKKPAAAGNAAVPTDQAPAERMSADSDRSAR